MKAKKMILNIMALILCISLLPIGALTAHAESEMHTVTVTNGTASVSGAEVTEAAEGETVTIHANTPESGKIFEKWEIDSPEGLELEAETDFETRFSMPAEPVSVTAVYVDIPAMHDLRIAAKPEEGGRIFLSEVPGYDETVLEDWEEISLAMVPEDEYTVTVKPSEGYVFKDWEDEDGKAVSEENPYTFTLDTDLVLYAVLEKEPEPTATYTVSFDANGGSGMMADATVVDGASYALPECGFGAPKSMTFVGWDRGAVGNVITVSGDLVLKAQWKHVHELKALPAKAATCETDGNIAYYVCDGCGKYFEDAAATKEIADKSSVIVKAFGHETLKAVAAKAAACETDGNIAYYVCDGCGKYFEDAAATKEILDKDSMVVKALGHDWDEWKVTKEATETETGEETRICKNDPEHKETREIPVVIAYHVTSGAGGAWNKGSGKDFELVVKRGGAEDTSFQHFSSLQIDGKTMEKDKDYTVKAGSTVITIKAAALERLSSGKHTVTVVFDDGSVQTSLTSKTAGQGGATTPKTGDESDASVWLLAMLASAVCLRAAYARGKRLSQR